MLRQRWSRVVALAFCIALSLPSASVFGGIIHFEDTEVFTNQGTVSYAGGNAPLIGQGIRIDLINDGEQASVNCEGCFLNFTTGPNIGSSLGVQTFAGGGSITLDGATSGPLAIANTNLLSGSFSEQSNLAVLNGAQSLITGGTGEDIKNQELIDHFQETGPFVFAFSTLTLGNITPLANGGFTAGVDEVDLINQTVPIPNAMLLMGTGLMGLILFRRFKTQ